LKNVETGRTLAAKEEALKRGRKERASKIKEPYPSGGGEEVARSGGKGAGGNHYGEGGKNLRGPNAGKKRRVAS